MPAAVKTYDLAYPSNGPNDVGLKTIRAVEVFRVGTWNGDEYTLDDLNEMVSAFTQVGYPVPIKFGHDEQSGMPAVGWVDRIYVLGDVLYADFKDLSPWVFSEIVDYHAYDAVSVEIYFNLNRDGKTYKRALKAVALLGAETPAVSGLAPLREAVFAADAFEKIASCSVKVAQQMPDPVKKPEVDAETTAKLTAQAAEIAKLQADKAESDKQVAALKAQSESTAAQLAAFAARDAKRDIEARVAKCEVPALKAHFSAIIDALSGATSVHKFTAKAADGTETTIEKPIGQIVDELIAHTNKLTANATRPFAQRTGQPIPQNDDGGQYANASQEVAEKVKSHRAANTKASYEEAMRAVLTADPALQQRYVEFTQRSGRAN